VSPFFKTIPPCASIFVFEVDIHVAPGTIQELAAHAAVTMLLKAKNNRLNNIMVMEKDLETTRHRAV
jgi:hypothetical protein